MFKEEEKDEEARKQVIFKVPSEKTISFESITITSNQLTTPKAQPRVESKTEASPKIRHKLRMGNFVESFLSRLEES